MYVHAGSKKRAGSVCVYILVCVVVHLSLYLLIIYVLVLLKYKRGMGFSCCVILLRVAFPVFCIYCINVYIYVSVVSNIRAGYDLMLVLLLFGVLLVFRLNLLYMFLLFLEHGRGVCSCLFYCCVL